ncbi:MAG: CapA family protein [bacterium]
MATSLCGAVGVVNLEGPLIARDPATGAAPLVSGAGSASRPRLFNGARALAVLANAGVGVAGIANNHAGDFGQAGARETERALRAAGIRPAGNAAGVARLEIGGVRIAVSAHDLEEADSARIAADLASGALDADFLIATFHETGPPSYLPSRALRRAVEIALANGADAVAAHGRHTLGAVERRGGAVIAWGLGNMAFACRCTDERDAIVLRLALEPGAPVEAFVIPIEAGLDGGDARPSDHPDSVFDLLEALGSRGVRRGARWARF